MYLFDFVGVFLRFNNTSIVNNSKFTVSDVGNDDHDKIRCYSDRSGCCMSSVPADSYEEWKFPNGSVVPKQNSTIFVTRENGFIGLNRINNETVPRGEYCCEAHDGRKIKRRVCIEIQGEYLKSCVCISHVCLRCPIDSRSIMHECMHMTS